MASVNRYFGSVDKKNLQAVLDCFNEDAVFTIQSHLTVHKGRDAGIREMFVKLFEYKSIVHTDFENISRGSGMNALPWRNSSGTFLPS